MQLKNIATAILTVIFLLLFNTLLLITILRFNPSWLIYNHTYQAQHQEMLTYLLTGNDQKLLKMLPQDEFSHIKDVRGIIAKIPLTLFLIIAVTSYLAKKEQNISIIAVINYSIAIILGISLLGGLFFMPLFIFFHQIFFPQGNWSFAESSILIQLYPEQFWEKCGAIIGILTLIEIVLLKYLKKH